jgi:hypothetical protein
MAAVLIGPHHQNNNNNLLPPTVSDLKMAPFLSEMLAPIY